jgi:hypothetical protein
MAKQRYAALLPHDKKLILWVQSPNGYWMLLSGHWRVASVARRYARAAGYQLIEQEQALAEIERQMNERAVEEDISFASDVTRDTVVTLRTRKH